LERKKKLLPTDKKIIGFVGQMIPRKNIKDILEIFDDVQQDVPNIELQLLGDGESRSELERYSQTLKSAEKIRFLGFRHNRLDYVMNFDLFAMTSKDEGIPRCLMEAMAMEVPVSAYDIQGVDQLLMHGKTGLLSEFGNKKHMRECWISILTDNYLSRKLSKNARQFIDDNFSAKRMSNEYSKVFESMTN
jgi:glycosyltransferase involved in cell wall biosynthesis